MLDARLRHREGDLDRAVALYREAAGAFPTRPELPLELGLVYADLGRLREAARQFERVLELRPTDSEAQRRLREIRARLAAES